MTRRLVGTIVAVVAGALVFAVVGTQLFLRVRAGTEARHELARQARAMANGIEVLDDARALAALRQALQLQGEAVLRFGPAGRTIDAPPPGVSVADLDLTALRAGQTVDGAHRNVVYAAAGAVRGRQLVVVVLTRKVAQPVQRRALRWLLLSSALALAVATVVAVDLGRRLTRPLRAAEEATGKIAGGDLAARVAVEPGRDDELTALSRSINAMAEALERSKGLERQFLLSVSHDLRTPLTSIRGYAEAIAEGKAPDLRKSGAVILAEARRLERLVGDLLELAKLEARGFTLDLRPTDVAEVVTETAEGFRPAADDEGIRLDIDYTSNGGVVAADPDRLAQIVANLVDNALKFASSTIRVTTAGEHGGAVVAVEDDGPGIPAAELSHVFDRFYTGARPAARQRGSGLGLAIVRELSEAMGATAEAQPGPHGGARMTVHLAPWTDGRTRNEGP